MLEENSTEKSNKYMVRIMIQNKKDIPDPEGQTILKDLIRRGGYNQAYQVRSAKTLDIYINSNSQNEALDLVKKMAEDLRLYNPVISECTFGVFNVSIRSP